VDSIITLIFFVGYIVFEYPSILIMQKVGCKLWLPTICLAFGAITVGASHSNILCESMLIRLRDQVWRLLRRGNHLSYVEHYWVSLKLVSSPDVLVRCSFHSQFVLSISLITRSPVTVLISTWYTRYETQKRLAVFYLTSKVG
jgi:hypothetical protein